MPRLARQAADLVTRPDKVGACVDFLLRLRGRMSLFSTVRSFNMRNTWLQLPRAEIQSCCESAAASRDPVISFLLFFFFLLPSYFSFKRCGVIVKIGLMLQIPSETPGDRVRDVFNSTGW